jgi:hypothetical protein
VFIGNAGTKAVNGVKCIVQPDSGQSVHLAGNTFYNLDTCVQFPAVAAEGRVTLYDNYVTDCGKWLDNLYEATGEVVVLEFNTRIRDVDTPRTGVQQAILSAQVTTAGSASTDYTDAANDNLVLLAAAPGRNVGLMPNTDIGALQRVEPTGGGGGGSGWNRIPGMG